MSRLVVPQVLQFSDAGRRSFEKNQRLHDLLKGRKNIISDISNWATLKRLTNDFELICGSDSGGVSRMTPISRSYFKMWEILVDHLPRSLISQQSPMQCAFLAEGPGGFVESFATMRSRLWRQGVDDRLNCITLVQRGAPAWNQLQSRNWVRVNANKCVMHFGKDGSGDLYRVENIDHFAASVGEGSCHLVTADGGFDVSIDYNTQEQLSLRLQLCETYAALRLQRPGGIFVLKIFDICDSRTISLIWIILRMYDCVKLVKPLTSRPANSEKYLVCTGYRPNPALRESLRPHLETGDLPSCFPDDLIDQLYAFNLRYIHRQIHHIDRTAALVSQPEIPAFPRPQQVVVAKDWCRKHNVVVRNRARIGPPETTPT